MRVPDWLIYGGAIAVVVTGSLMQRENADAPPAPPPPDEIEGALLGPVTPFDPSAPVGIYGRHLPHWRQDGMTYFVTFRLADSIPQARLREWEREMTDWLKKNPEPHNVEQKAEFHEQFTEKFQQWLYLLYRTNETVDGNHRCKQRGPVHTQK